MPDQFKTASYQPIIEVLSSELPSILWRHKWPEYQEAYGVPFSRGTLQNRDSQGRGPKAFKATGKRVYYLREDFLEWLAALSDEGEE